MARAVPVMSATGCKARPATAQPTDIASATARIDPPASSLPEAYEGGVEVVIRFAYLHGADYPVAVAQRQGVDTDALPARRCRVVGGLPGQGLLDGLAVDGQGANAQPLRVRHRLAARVEYL